MPIYLAIINSRIKEYDYNPFKYQQILEMTTNPHRLLPKFTLIFSGVLLSLSLRLITDELILLFKVENITEIFNYIEPSLVLAFVTLVYFLDDIIENTLFLSSYPYKGTMRFYLDTSICSAFYLCILIACDKSTYYLFSFALMTAFTAIWSIMCIKRGTGPTRYLYLNFYLHMWGSLFAIGLFIWLLINHNNPDTILKASLYFLIFWLLLYNLARVIALRIRKCEGAEFLEAGLIMRLFIYASMLIPLKSEIN